MAINDSLPSCFAAATVLSHSACQSPSAETAAWLPWLGDGLTLDTGLPAILPAEGAAGTAEPQAATMTHRAHAMAANFRAPVCMRVTPPPLLRRTDRHWNLHWLTG